MPDPAEASQITLLLRRWAEGDADALARLVPLVYDRLRDIARTRRYGAGRDLSLDTTAVVHEAYLRLASAEPAVLNDRHHFLALASRVMRNLLVDHARARRAAKRGGGLGTLPLDEAIAIPEETLDVVRDLDEALARLEALEPRQSRILEQRYFGGLTLEETAAAMGVSPATVKRELRSARAWLALELGGEPPPVGADDGRATLA